MRVNVELFGGLTITGDEGPIDVGYARGRLLFAWLLLHAGKRQRREELAEALWPEEPEGSARRRLREVLFRLRKALWDGLRPEPWVRSERAHLTLVPGTELSCDVLRFDALVDEASTHQHRAIEHCRACLHRLREATLLHQGELLAGVEVPKGPARELVETHRRARRDTACWALGVLGRSALLDGDTVAARAIAEQITDRVADDEAALRLRMRALVAEGRRAEAVRAYEDFAERLQALGRPPPDDDSEELYQSLVHNDYLTPEARRDAVHVPAPVNGLVGRDDELRWVLDRLGRPGVRLVTLAGMGGVGKTHLALEVARQAAAGFRDGVWFVSAIDCATRHDLVLATGAVLGVPLRGAAPLAEVLAWVAEKEALWVLDNLEQVEDAAALIDEILRQAPGLRILATSRRRLAIRAEHLRHLRGLDADHAQALWCARARQLDPDLEIDHEHVATICGVLGGLPLAIEFAAARSLDMTCAEIAASMRDGLELQSAWSDVPLRQASLRRMLQEAVASLTVEQRSALGAITVFRGWFQPRAAEHVCGVGREVLDALCDRAWLMPSDGDRYAMHPLVAAYAREAFPFGRDLEAAHRRWFLVGERCTVAEAHLERDDVERAWRSSVEAADTELIADRSYALQLQWRGFGWHRHAARWFAFAADRLHAQDSSTPAARRAMACAGLMALRIGAADEARTRLMRARELATDAADDRDIIRSSDWLSCVLRNVGHPESALGPAAEALNLAERIGDPSVAQLRYNHAIALYESGDLREARAELVVAVDGLIDAGDVVVGAVARSVLGLVAVLLGDFDEGLDGIAHAARDLRATGGADLANLLNAWACASLIAGRPRDAILRARAGLARYRETGFLLGIASVSTWLAMALITTGPAAEAEVAVRHAVAACRHADSRRSKLEAASLLAMWLAEREPSRSADLLATVEAHDEPIAELRALIAPLRRSLQGGVALPFEALERQLVAHA